MAPSDSHPAPRRPRTALALALATGCGGGGGDASAVDPGVAEASPNILLIVLDDFGVDKLAVYGTATDAPRTPVLDALAARGVRFETVWSNPVCTPTRATIQTGRYGLRTGMGWISLWDGLPQAETTLPEMLDAGTGGRYAHAAIGKWHLGHRPAAGAELAPTLAGYDHFAGTLQNGGDYDDYTKVVDGQSSNETTYRTTAEVDDALAFIASAPEPWFCYLALSAPHAPYHAPPAALHGVDLSQAGPPESNPLPYFDAMVEAMDTELGRLFAGLGTELAETEILLVGDNGTASEVVTAPRDPGKAKWTLYEGGIRVPLIAAGPSVAHPGTVSAALVNTTDLFATVAELAGVDPSLVPADSVSLVPYLEDPGTPSRRDWLLSEIFLPNFVQFAKPFVPAASAFVCQADVGLGGPGSATLSVCGQELATGNRTELVVSGAPPSAPTTILASYATTPAPKVPFPMFGGTVGPRPPWLSHLPGDPPTKLDGLATDAAGELRVPGIGTLGPIYLHVQAAIEDPAQPGGYQLTNAVSIAFWPHHEKAIRDARYKIVSSVNGGPEQLYDLLLDPLEQDDLLLHPQLTPEEQAALTALRARLAALIAGA